MHLYIANGCSSSYMNVKLSNSTIWRHKLEGGGSAKPNHGNPLAQLTIIDAVRTRRTSMNTLL
jgi:hypothetical protein